MSLGRTSENYATIEDCRAGMPTPLANGRIDILKPSSLKLEQYDSDGARQKGMFCTEAIRGQWQATDLSNTYFSIDNMEALQKGIRALVYKRSGKVIGRQSDQELKIIMKGMYLQYARHDPNQPILEQVRTLNGYVLDYCVNNILTNLEQYEKYRTDISTMPVPLDRGQIATNKGNNSLEMKSWF